MRAESRPGSLTGLPDDMLGTIAVSLSVAELHWTPDVAPAVMDRISRDAVTYPEQFDRRSRAAGPGRPPRAERSAKRTMGRLAIFGILLFVIVALVLFAASVNASAAAAVPEGLRVRLEPVAQGFDQPVFVSGSGDGSGDLYVVEQTGRIRVVDADGTIAEAPFLDLGADISRSYERGLLGLAFHPDYADNGRLFVDYTRVGDGATVVSEFQAGDAGADVADRGSERQLLVIEQPFANHNGGMVAFDATGKLLIGTGDGGSGGDPFRAAQDPATLLGKLLRVDVDAADAEPEILALGLRNPWRFSVDPATGHVYIGDVGQGSWEEISVLPAGASGVDFGWNEVEGPECFTAGCDLDAHTPPALSYGRSEGCTVIGGYVYRGSEQPALDGIYVFGDYCTGTIWGADAAEMAAGTAQSVPIGSIGGTLVSFGTDDAGEIHAVDQDGSILHVVATEAS